MQSLFQSTLKSRNRTSSVSSTQTTISSNSYYSVNNSSIAESTDIDEDLRCCRNTLSSNEEIEHVCKCNDPLKLNSMKMPDIQEVIRRDTIVKLDEGSSGSILKAMTKLSKKTYVVKVFKTTELPHTHSVSKPISRTHSTSSSPTTSVSLSTVSGYSTPSTVSPMSPAVPTHSINMTKSNSIGMNRSNSISMIKRKPSVNNSLNNNMSSANALNALNSGMNNFNLKSSAQIPTSNINPTNHTPLSIAGVRSTPSSITSGTNELNIDSNYIVNDNNEASIRPLYTFDTLNEFLILNKLKSKYVTPVHGLFKCLQDDNAMSTMVDSNLLDSLDTVENNEEDVNKPIEVDPRPIRVCIVLDYYTNSDLLRLITSIRKGNIKTTPIFKDYIFMQLVQGLKFLHSQNIIHRDIKPENILIDNFGTLKFSDFGYAIDMSRFDDYPMNDEYFLYRGTTSFKSPEVVNKKLGKLIKDCKDNDEICKILKSTDIWSLGILFYQIKFLNKIWKVSSSEDSEFKKYKETYELKRIHSMKTGFDMLRSFSNFESFTNNLKTLKDDVTFAIFKILNPNYKERWIIQDLYRSEWLVGVRMLVENKEEENELIRILRIIK